MTSQIVMSLLVGRKAGEAAGVADEDLGKLSMLSYFVANPVLAMVAARSMAGRGEGPEKPDEVIDAADRAAASEAAAKAAAEAAAKSALAAKAAADAAQKVADTLKPPPPSPNPAQPASSPGAPDPPPKGSG